MPLSEKVTDYTATVLKNDVVTYTRVLRLTTESGHTAFLAFEPTPRAAWLEVTASYTNVFLPSDEFDRTYHLLQTESPVYLTAINFIGLRAYNLSTGPELPGEGPGDEDALVELAARIREQVTGPQD
ncbi:hypothetical protein [Leifsonia poae]|uniref:Uncharacterized protein n=1 Tax=Leifsonia poae TaxID=110933 RepID=A0A9W6H719_9MICO|nr:hypothetical protein [Leifsonia poae]GLJ74468.1 hypothetical protein GCM10017584_00410 [Leifsonia poae]